MPTQTSIPIPPRLLIRCRRSERGNLEANVATTIRQKIAAHYITASTEFSNPGSLMRNSSFLIWVWLPLIWNRVFLIWGALPPMRNTPFLIRVWLPLTWNSPFLIGGALPPRRNSPFLIRVWLPLIWNDRFLIWGALPSTRNGSSLIRVCLPPMRKSRFLIWGKASLFREAGYPANSGNRKPDGFGRQCDAMESRS